MQGSFADEPSEWAEEEIFELKEEYFLEPWVFKDYGGNISREDFVYLAVSLYERLHEAIEVSPEISFSDTDNVYALKAATIGITSGLGGGRFGPEDLLTREQMAVFLVRTLELSQKNLVNDQGLTFEDDHLFSSWAREAIYKAKSNNLVSGVGDNRFDSKGYASKEASLVIVYRILSNFDDTNHLSQEEIEALNMQVSDTVFTDYLKNIDYSNPHIFLGHGKQSLITDVTYDFVKDINNKRDFSTLSEIYKTMTEKLYKPTPSENKDFIGMTYTNEDFINEEFLYGCTTFALVYSNMARAKGIPTVLVEGLNIDFINRFTNDLGGGMNGHFFVEVLIKGEWYLVDTTAGRLYLDYDKASKYLPGDNYLWAKGIDKWEFGKNEYGQEIPSPAKMRSVFIAEDIKEFKPPSYDYIDLNTMTHYEAQKTDTVSYISSGMTFVGKEAMSQSFYKVIGNQLGTYRFKSPSDLVVNDEVLNAIYIVIAYKQINDLDGPILDMYPEALLVEENRPVYIVKHGRRVGFFKAETDRDLDNLLSSVSRDFFIDKQYKDNGLIERASSLDMDIFQSVDIGDEILGKESYAFDSGGPCERFWSIVGLSRLKKGMIFTNLDEYLLIDSDIKTYLVSGEVNYEDLPEALRSIVDRDDYLSFENILKVKFEDIDIFFIKE
jgi:hypothetical protein